MLHKLGTAIDAWLEERFKISFLKKWLGKKEVPQHEQSMWYYFGGIALFLFLIQVITGLLLMVYYQPGIETSHASVKFITEKVEFGWLVRSIHSWAANLMVGVLFIHMFSAFFMKAYKAPREVTWLTGFVLFVITLGLGFSGYLLPWDELSFFATQVGLKIMAATPGIGPWMADLLRGGEIVGGATISRFFELHVWLLPAALIGVLGLHLMMVQIHGMSQPYHYANKPAKYRKSISFMEEFLYQDMILWSVLLGGVIFVASAFPWGLGEIADPFAPAPAGIKPEWYFMFMFQFLKQLPAHIGPTGLQLEGEVFGILLFGVAGLLWALVPFWGTVNRTMEKLATWFGVIAVAAIISLTAWGYLEGGAPPLASTSAGQAVSAQTLGEAETLFKQNCQACHSIGGGALAGPDLKGITATRDKATLAKFVANPEGSKMPQIPGIDEAKAMQILDYIEAQSNPKPATEAAAEASEPAVIPFTPQDVENGRNVFLGVTPLAKGGASCTSCHSVQGATAFGGGNLGNDLTHVYSKLGGRQGLEPWLTSMPNLTMKPLYQDQPLTPEEVHALTAFFEYVDTQKLSPDALRSMTGGSKRHYFVSIGLGGVVLVLLLFALIYHNRFRGVRRHLVEEANEQFLNKGDH